MQTTSSGASVTQTAEPSSTPEVVNRVNDYAVVTPSDVPPTNTPDNGNTGLVSERVITGASQGDTHTHTHTHTQTHTHTHTSTIYII